MQRRDFLAHMLGVAAVPALAPLGDAAEVAPRHIVLRSSWQAVNIGDIGHTPGALRLLETYLPKAKITLWPMNLDLGVKAMLQRAFPRVRIAEGKLDRQGQPTTPELRTALDRADLLLHGSGPSVVAWKDFIAWRRIWRKPYGIYGVTIEQPQAELHELLSAAAFVFCRDTISVDVIRKAGVKCPTMEFAPDATFAIPLRNDAQAAGYLRTQGLEPRKFVCAIPRLRYTPYYKIHHKQPTPRDLQREQVSEQFRERDHAKLREAIVAWVRRTGLPVLACPEMTYQVELAKQVLVDPLPADVRPKVVWRDSYWLPDEAGSVYAQARAVVSFEMHSPIIAAAMGTPAFYLRQPTDTSKGQMWRDIGLERWMFEIDATRGSDIADRLQELHRDYPAAQARLTKAMEFVARRQRESMAVVGRSVGLR
jgi:polysaccharide pyruvyl transferase WcaK-like protein